MTTLDAQAFVPESTPTVAAALWQPERRLMLAVLEDALCDCLANAGALRGIRLSRFRHASDWFRSDDRVWPFSFVNICEACNLDYELDFGRSVEMIFPVDASCSFRLMRIASPALR